MSLIVKYWTAGMFGGGAALPLPDALFDTRTGINIIDSKNGESISVRSFPASRYYTSLGSGWYTQIETTEPTPQLSGDYTLLFVCNRDNYGVLDIVRTGANKYVRLSLGETSISLTASDFTTAIGQNVTYPAAVIVTYDSTIQQVSIYVAGVLKRQGTYNWDLNTSYNLYWRGYSPSTDCIFFGFWHFNRILSTEEIINLNSGIFPAENPIRQYVHNKYLDIYSDTKF